MESFAQHASLMTTMSEVLTDKRPTALLAMRLAVSRPPPVAPWPSPELSLGNKCSSFGIQQCWEVTGPAQLISVDIFSAVKGLLSSQSEYLNEKESKPCFIMFGLYMIGHDEAHANPTLILSCERKTPRRKALKLVRESGILSSKPGVRLAESTRPPLCLQPPRILGSVGDIFKTTGVFSDMIYWSPSEPICGVPVYKRKSSGDSFAFSYQATVGGVVSLNNINYGLSTAHTFLGEDIDSSAPDDDSDFEFAFDDLAEPSALYDASSLEAIQGPLNLGN